MFGTAAALAFLVACTTTPSSGGATRTTLRIGVNLEYGGTQIDWDQTVAVARALNADVIGLEEAWGNARKLAAGSAIPTQTLAGS